MEDSSSFYQNSFTLTLQLDIPKSLIVDQMNLNAQDIKSLDTLARIQLVDFFPSDLHVDLASLRVIGE